MTVRIELATGEKGELRAVDGNQATLESPRAFAPGAPLQFTVELAGAARSLEGRTIGSKRLADGAFVVRLRFVNLRRDVRQLLEAALSD